MPSFFDDLSDEAVVEEEAHPPMLLQQAPQQAPQQPTSHVPTENDNRRTSLVGTETAQKGIVHRDALRSLLITQEEERDAPQEGAGTPLERRPSFYDGLEFEDSVDDEAAVRMDMYADGVEGLDIVPDDMQSYEPTIQEEMWDDVKSGVRSFTEFVAGPEMALLGMKWDEEGFEFGKEVFMKQVMDHPYETAFTVATYAFPVGFAARRGVRLAERGVELAAKANKSAASLGLNEVLGESTVAGKGFLERRGGLLGAAVAKGVAKVPVIKSLHLDKAGFKFNDTAELTLALARKDMNTPDAKGIGRYFDKDMTEALGNAKSSADVERIVPRTQLEQMITNERANDRYLELQKLARKKALTTPALKAAWAMEKRFTNTYAEAVQNLNADHIDNLSKYLDEANVQEYWDSIPIFDKADEALAGDAIYEYFLDGMSTDAIEKLAETKGVGTKALQWSRDLGHSWSRLTDTQYAEGYITKDTHDLYRAGGGMVESGMHLPAVKKGTAGFTNLSGGELKTYPKTLGNDTVLDTMEIEDSLKIFGGPTTKARRELLTREDTRAAIPGLETNLKDMFIGGYVKDVQTLGIHRTMRDIIVDHVESGGVKWDEYITSRTNYDDLVKQGSEAADHWLPMSELDNVVPGMAATMRRMVDARVAKDGLDAAKHGEDMVISRQVLKQFFKHDGALRDEPSDFTRLMRLSTAIYKSAKTALNPATHIGNMMGNLHFMMQAGLSPFRSRVLNDGHVAAKMFHRVAKQLDTLGGEERKMAHLMTPENLADKLGKDRFIENRLGHEIDLADHFSDPIVNQMFEAQAFETVEGFASAEKMMEKMQEASKRGFKGKSMAALARVMAGHQEIPGIKQTMHKASSMYLAEDMVPKAQYYTHLIREGWGRQAAVREVGRRFPQYATVGKLPKASRRLVLPWITWTAESARILKNNMQDFPLSSMVHLQAPQIIQGLISGAGVGPSTRKERDDAFENAPEHSVRFGSAVIDGEAASPVLSTTGSAALGAIGGMRYGGAPGALFGAAGGAMAGYMMSQAGGRPDGDAALNRVITNDWLTQATLAPSSLSPERWDKLTSPFRDGGASVTGVEWIKALVETLPVAPLAVAMPLLDIMSGTDSFGNEVKSDGPAEALGKAALQMMNHHLPPSFTKYMGNVSGSHLNPISAAQAFANNGSQATIPNHMTPGYQGISSESTQQWTDIDDDGNKTLTGAGLGIASGAGVFVGLKKAGVPTAAAAVGAIAQGVAAGIGGREINIKRMMVDMGWARDTSTEQVGDWTTDGFANNIAGITKSFAIGGQNAVRNQKFKDQAAGVRRGVVWKKIKDAWRDDQPEIAASHMKSLYDSFLEQYGDERVARSMYNEAVGRALNEVAGSKTADGISLERNTMMLKSLKAAQNEVTQAKEAHIRERNIVQSEKLFKTGAVKLQMSDEPHVNPR